MTATIIVITPEKLTISTPKSPQSPHNPLDWRDQSQAEKKETHREKRINQKQRAPLSKRERKRDRKAPQKARDSFSTAILRLACKISLCLSFDLSRRHFGQFSRARTLARHLSAARGVTRARREGGEKHQDLRSQDFLNIFFYGDG